MDKRNIVAAALTLSFLSVGSATGQEIQIESDTGRFITMTGTGVSRIQPDCVVVRLGVVEWHKELRMADNASSVIVAKVLDLTKKFKVENADVQTSEINVSPTYKESEYDNTRPTGYTVRRDLTCRLKDIPTLAPFLTDALAAGAKRIYSIEFESSNLRKFKDEARVLAIRAAREKASSAAAEVSSKIGKAITLKEVGSTVSALANAGRYQGQAFSNTIQDRTLSGLTADAGATIAPGQLEVMSSVLVTFEMVD